MELIIARSGLTQAEIARRLAVKPQSVHQWRSGTRSNPSLKWFMRLAQVCGVRLVVELPQESI
jgi:transcriptional regulator with XRE-family HTH domain